MQESTAVESVHRTTLLIAIISSVSRLLASWAQFRAIHSSNWGMVCCRLGATPDLAMIMASWIWRLAFSVCRYETEPSACSETSQKMCIYWINWEWSVSKYTKQQGREMSAKSGSSSSQSRGHLVGWDYPIPSAYPTTCVLSFGLCGKWEDKTKGVILSCEYSVDVMKGWV